MVQEIYQLNPWSLRTLGCYIRGLLPRCSGQDGELPFDWAAVLALRGQIDQPDPRWREQTRSITVPTLFVSGGPSSYLRRETITELAQALPHAGGRGPTYFPEP